MSTEPTIKAKPTWYRSIRFDSRLEAIWACFFDVLGVEWKREPIKFSLPGFDSGYLPDFKLLNVVPDGPLRDLYVELRPAGRRNEKAAALSSAVPVLELFDEPIRNQEMRLHYRGHSAAVRFSGTGQLVSCATGEQPLGEHADMRVLRAAFRSTDFQFEASHTGTETALLGLPVGALAQLSRNALLLLHLLNSLLQQPAPRAAIYSAAAEHGVAQLDAELALGELAKAGLLDGSARRRTLLEHVSLY